MDMSQYLDLFLQDSREQLEVLESETLLLEKDPTADRLSSIFRAAHSLKGSSRAMGFHRFAELTHEMENVLDQLRNGTIQVSTAIADAVLECADTLNQMVASISDGKGDAVECAHLVAKFQGFLGAASADPRTQTQPAEKSEELLNVEAHLTDQQRSMVELATGYVPVYHARFTLQESCAMKFARAFMACSEIQKNGEIILSLPDAEALEEEQFEHSFDLIFGTQEPIDELVARLSSIGEMESVECTPWKAAQPAASAATESAEISTKPELVAQAAVQGPPTKEASGKKVAETGQSVRVDVARLDMLMNLVGELVIDRTRISQIGSDLSMKFDDPNIEALEETVSHIHRITNDLQDQIMKARMMPIETVFNRFPRVVRDLANKLNKDIELDVTGGDTELDRSVIEVIGDPLLHILRNSVDHGIESPEDREKMGKPRKGTIWLSARHQENHIVIEIRDDGKGIDVERVKAKAVANGMLTPDAAQKMLDKEALQLIFSSGLSTAQEVTDVSGRGVGMDIVRSNLQKLGGIIDMDSAPGQGTKFSLRLPLTLAIIRGLLVRVDGQVYVVPLGSVVETLALDPSEIQSVNRNPVIVLRGLATPLVKVRDVFNIPEGPQEEGANSQQYIVIVGLADQRVGLVVDELVGEREVVIKSISRFCGEVQGVSGATILGDGKVALIFDVNLLIEKQKVAA